MATIIPFPNRSYLLLMKKKRKKLTARILNFCEKIKDFVITLLVKVKRDVLMVETESERTLLVARGVIYTIVLKSHQIARIKFFGKIKILRESKFLRESKLWREILIS